MTYTESLPEADGFHPWFQMTRDGWASGIAHVVTDTAGLGGWLCPDGKRRRVKAGGPDLLLGLPPPQWGPPIKPPAAPPPPSPPGGPP